VDRRVATSCFVLVVALLVPIAAASETTAPPERPTSTHDPAAAAELIAAMRAGEGADVILDYTFTRVRPDDRKSLSSGLTSMRYGEASLSRASDTLTVQLPEVSYLCQRVEGEASCFKRNEPAPVPRSQRRGRRVLRRPQQRERRTPGPRS
jgi:hypothetical protein